MNEEKSKSFSIQTKELQESAHQSAFDLTYRERKRERTEKKKTLIV